MSPRRKSRAAERKRDTRDSTLRTLLLSPDGRDLVAASLAQRRQRLDVIDSAIPPQTLLETVVREIRERTDLPPEIGVAMTHALISASMVQTGSTVRWHDSAQQIELGIWMVVLGPSASGKTLIRKIIERALNVTVVNLPEPGSARAFLDGLAEVGGRAFWLRDASFIVGMYDVTGYPEYARQDLDFFKQWQQPDGNFVSQGGQFDGVGQVLWAYGQHYEITHDLAFAQEVFPSVVKAVAWIKQARQEDPLHLMPATRPGDNEDITGHVTGHNFWALAGLKNAVILANATGNKKEAADFRQEYNDFLATLVNVLDRVTKNTDGYIPPGLDGQHGQDWGNMEAVYPEIILSPDDPMVVATLNATRAKYREGIMTYGDEKFLHDYLGFSNTETELIQGKQELVVKDLYAELVHTSSTHAGFETDIPVWGDRDFRENLSPHGWYAARLRICVRNMLVREQGQDLHLLSAISPA
jgi:hypothetical protein